MQDDECAKCASCCVDQMYVHGADVRAAAVYLERLEDLEGVDAVGVLGSLVRGDALGEERLLRFATRSRGAASSQADALALSAFSGCAGA